MTHLDLFSGIGGFALAAKWAGIETVQFVEIDPFCQRVLAKNFPGVPIHGDIRTFTYAEHDGWNGVEITGGVEKTSNGSKKRQIEPIESTGSDRSPIGRNFGEQKDRPFLLTGGFPCQPFSCAGKRRGKEDDRFLWPEMLRAVSEARPDWVIGENVAGFINMGLDDCISDLEDQGYEVQAFIIPACAVGAPHRRDRVWIVGNRQECGWREGHQNAGGTCKGTGTERQRSGSPDADRHAPDTESREALSAEPGGLHAESGGKDRIIGNTERTPTESISPTGRSWHTVGESNRWDESWLKAATRLCRVDDGLPRQVDRVNRLKALGNAIVPQVAFEIMRVILEVEREGENGNKFVSSRWGFGSGG